MKKIISLFLILSFAGLVPLLGQENPANAKAEEKPTLKATVIPTYNAEGRRDPFKDLLGGGDVRDKTATGESQLSMDDLVLIGIIKSKKGYTAIVGTSQGFPHFLTVGDAVADGYVLSISQNQVVFRKTHERGIPLMRPRDIVKEINPEER
jgi:Tfp pilus assembly protein PilP